MIRSGHSTLDPLDDIPPSPVLDLREHVAAALAGSSIDRETLDGAPSLVDGLDELSSITAGVDSKSPGSLIVPRAINNPSRIPAIDHPRLRRDQEILLEVARYRVVSFAHLRRFLFADRTPAVLTRRMQALKQGRFITTWEERLPRGGHPHYALLTERGLQWALRTLGAQAAGHAHERLVRFMLRARARKPLFLPPNSAPPFLPHQTETNFLAALLRATPDLGITWASTWHRPFPNQLHELPMPQPDAVLVAVIDGRPQLVFLEHDRGQEAPASFAARKTMRYQLLLDRGLAPELFGFERFTVLVTITDPARNRPLERLRALQDVSAAASMMRFSLASWVIANPEAAVWFGPQTPVGSTALEVERHAGLLPPFSNLGAHPS